MLDKTSSIIFAFGLAAAAPRSPYRHLELCGVAYKCHGEMIHINQFLFFAFGAEKRKIVQNGIFTDLNARFTVAHRA